MVASLNAAYPPVEIFTLISEGRKFGFEDLTDDLIISAETYAKAYSGSFDFMVDMNYAVNRWGRLTAGQAKGTLNCWLAEIKRNAKPIQRENTPTQSAPSPAVAIKDGLYTVVLDSGEHRTLRIRTGKDDAKDMQFVSYLSGSNNEGDYTCCGYIRNGTYSWTRRFTANGADNTAPLSQAVNYLLAASDDDRTAYGRAYALQSGNCYRCNRTLTDPTSIELGIGPVCRGDA